MNKRYLIIFIFVSALTVIGFYFLKFHLDFFEKYLNILLIILSHVSFYFLSLKVILKE